MYPERDIGLIKSSPRPGCVRGQSRSHKKEADHMTVEGRSITHSEPGSPFDHICWPNPSQFVFLSFLLLLDRPFMHAHLGNAERAIITQTVRVSYHWNEFERHCRTQGNITGIPNKAMKQASSIWKKRGGA